LRPVHAHHPVSTREREPRPQCAFRGLFRANFGERKARRKRAFFTMIFMNRYG